MRNLAVKMKIAVIGAGAVGKSIGGLLQAANHEVHYLVRSEFSALKSRGLFTLHFAETNISLKISPIYVYNKAEQLPKVDLVLITTKTTENQHLVPLVTPCLGAQTTLLIVQNGIGNEEALEEMFPHHPLICGITSIAASRTDVENVEIACLGELRLAPIHQRAEAVCQNISETLNAATLSPKIILSDSYKSIRWHKLIWNAAFNPLSVIFNKTSDILAIQEPYLTIVRHIFEEVRQTAACESISISEEFTKHLLEHTAHLKSYWPSMYYDFQKGKQLEVEYILGNLIKIADKHHLTLPCLTLVRSHIEHQAISRIS